MGEGHGVIGGVFALAVKVKGGVETLQQVRVVIAQRVMGGLEGYDV